jgi:hypothetical protein
MKRHTTLPNGKNFKGVVNVVSKVVKQNVSKSSTKNDTKKAIIENRFRLFFCGEIAVFLEKFVGENKAKNVSKGIPS